MNYTIERVQWKDYGDVVAEMLRLSFPRVPVARYERLHEGNPAGPSILWIARAGDGRPIGTAAVHGRRILVDGRGYRAGQAADFVVAPSARVFGPALALQREVVAACDQGEFDFVYGFPNHAARGVFERLGYRPGNARRLARPLRTRPYLERLGPLAAVAQFVAKPVDLALQLASRETYRRPSNGLRLERVDAFDASFDAFWKRVRRQHSVIAYRDSAYMNWRYAQWPTRRYELAVLRCGTEVIATVVSYRIADIAYVAELLAVDTAAFDALMTAFLRVQRRAGVSAVSLILLGDDLGFSGRLAKYRFFAREIERSMWVYLPAGSPLAPALGRVDRWCLFEGDIL